MYVPSVKPVPIQSVHPSAPVRADCVEPSAAVIVILRPAATGNSVSSQSMQTLMYVPSGEADEALIQIKNGIIKAIIIRPIRKAVVALGFLDVFLIPPFSLFRDLSGIGTSNKRPAL